MAAGHLPFLACMLTHSQSLPPAPMPLPPAPMHQPLQVLELPDASKDQLQDAWKQWMQEAGACRASPPSWAGAAVTLLHMQSSCGMTGRRPQRLCGMRPPTRCPPPACLQWRIRALSRPETHPARRCGSSASEGAAGLLLGSVCCCAVAVWVWLEGLGMCGGAGTSSLAPAPPFLTISCSLPALLALKIITLHP